MYLVSVDFSDLCRYLSDMYDETFCENTETTKSCLTAILAVLKFKIIP